VFEDIEQLLNFFRLLEIVALQVSLPDAVDDTVYLQNGKVLRCIRLADVQ
jgi:hypothetical protein